MKTSKEDKTNNEPDVMNNEPSTFELAQLALAVQQQLKRDPKSGFKESIGIAISLWEEADAAKQARAPTKNYLAALKRHLLTATPKEWQALIDSCPPDTKRAAWEMLHTLRYPREEVTKHLYGHDSAANRETFFMGLPMFAAAHKMEGPPGYEGVFRKSADPNSDPVKDIQKRMAWDIPAKLCRWLVEVRQRQVSENKKRDNPPPKRPKKTGAEDTIQRKKSFRS